jgi:predicted Zn-ribbon and HTH transcriptional regulator
MELEGVRKKDTIRYGAYVLIEGHRCHRCGYEWRPNNIEVLPVACPNPKCHSPYWKNPRKKVDKNKK